MWLMQALGFLLSALQVEEILKNLHSLITPYIQQLEKLADETVSACMLAPCRIGFSRRLWGCCVEATLLTWAEERGQCRELLSGTLPLQSWFLRVLNI